MAFQAPRIATIGMVGLIVGGIAGAVPARADHRPVIVVPGKPGVPVMVDGVEVTGAVVYGDWGLHRAGHGSRLIDGGAWGYGPYWPGGFYPATGRQPAYGRREIEPPPGRPLPPAAEGYQKSWSAGSEPRPVTEYPPFDPPPVILAPRSRK